MDLANSEWNRINQSHGWVARVQHAVQQVVLAVHDVREQWNLLAAYELYTGTLLKVPDLVSMPGELERDKPEIWVKRLDQYRIVLPRALFHVVLWSSGLYKVMQGYACIQVSGHSLPEVLMLAPFGPSWSGSVGTLG